MDNKKILIAAVFVTFIPFFYFVWPTMYRYEHTKFGATELLVRINRVSNKTEMLYPEGWQIIEEPTWDENFRSQTFSFKNNYLGNQRAELIPSEIRFQGNNLYFDVNKSNNVTELNVSVTINKFLPKIYIFKPLSPATIYESKRTFVCDLGFEINLTHIFQCNIIGGKRIK